jgi:phage terminase small subunit
MDNHNATQAYIRAYKCTYNAARTAASNLMANHNIRDEIDRLRKLQQAELMIGPDDIVIRYMHIAFSNMNDFVRVDNKNDVTVAPSEIMDGGIVSEIKQTKFGVGIKLESRMKALKWLADHFNMNPMDKHKIEYDKQMMKLREKEVAIKESGW